MALGIAFALPPQPRGDAGGRLRQQPVDDRAALPRGHGSRLRAAGRLDRGARVDRVEPPRPQVLPRADRAPAAVPVAVRRRQHDPGRRWAGWAATSRCARSCRAGAGRPRAPRPSDVRRADAAGGSRCARWSAWPARSRSASSPRPAQELEADRQAARREPHGTDRPGMPARFAGTVKMSARYICSGSAVFSPRRNGGVGVVGVATTSQARKACSKSRRMSVRTFWARR